MVSKYLLWIKVHHISEIAEKIRKQKDPLSFLNNIEM